MKKKKKKSSKKNIAVGVVSILATFNNTIVTFADVSGDVFASSSPRRNDGFKGSRKATIYAAEVAAEAAMNEALTRGLKTIKKIQIKGIGIGGDAALKKIAVLAKRRIDNHSKEIAIGVISNITPIAHNGTKAPKRRRV